MQIHRSFTLAILTTFSLSPLVFGSPSPSPYYYYGDSGVPESQGQGGYGYKVPSSAYGTPQSQMDALLQEFGGIPEFQPMPNGPPIIPYGSLSSAAPPTATTTTTTTAATTTTTTKAPPPPPPPPAPTTAKPIVTPVTTAAAPPPAPASVETGSTLSAKAKILEGVLNVIDGIVEHKAKKAKAIYGLAQPKLALVSGLLQPKLQLVNELVVKPKLKKIVNHVRPSAVQIVTHYRPAIAKASMRLTPVIQRLTTSIGGLLSDPAAPAPASASASASVSSASASSSGPRITIDTNPRQKGSYTDLSAQGSNDVPVFYFANGAHSYSSTSYSYDPSQDSDVWSSYY